MKTISLKTCIFAALVIGSVFCKGEKELLETSPDYSPFSSHVVYVVGDPSVGYDIANSLRNNYLLASKSALSRHSGISSSERKNVAHTLDTTIHTSIPIPLVHHYDLPIKYTISVPVLNYEDFSELQDASDLPDQPYKLDIYRSITEAPSSELNSKTENQSPAEPAPVSEPEHQSVPVSSKHRYTTIAPTKYLAEYVQRSALEEDGFQNNYRLDSGSSAGREYVWEGNK